METRTIEEQQQLEAQNQRRGLLAILVLVFVSPFLLAVLFGAWSLAFAAFGLMMSQLG